MENADSIIGTAANIVMLVTSAGAVIFFILFVVRARSARARSKRIENELHHNRVKLIYGRLDKR